MRNGVGGWGSVGGGEESAAAIGANSNTHAPTPTATAATSVLRRTHVAPASARPHTLDERIACSHPSQRIATPTLIPTSFDSLPSRCSATKWRSLPGPTPQVSAAHSKAAISFQARTAPLLGIRLKLNRQPRSSQRDAQTGPGGRASSAAGDCAQPQRSESPPGSRTMLLQWTARPRSKPEAAAYSDRPSRSQADRGMCPALRSTEGRRRHHPTARASLGFARGRPIFCVGGFDG